MISDEHLIMNDKILVCYASKYGGTAKIAVKIAETLKRNSLKVDLMRVEEVISVEPYIAVILGSAIYMGRWRKSAVSFLKRNKKKLTGIPVWIFSSGPTGGGDPGELLKGWKFPKHMESLIAGINPRDTTVFHGALDMNKLTPVDRWIINRAKVPVGDYREWDTIFAWSQKVAGNCKEWSDAISFSSRDAEPWPQRKK